MPVDVAFDLEGIDEIQKEFNLTEKEIERSIEQATQETAKKVDRDVREQIVLDTGLSRSGARIRVRSGRRSRLRGSVWMGYNRIPIDYIKGAVKGRVGTQGGGFTIHGKYKKQRKVDYYVFGKLVPFGFRSPRGSIRGKGRLRTRDSSEDRHSRLVYSDFGGNTQIEDAMVKAFEDNIDVRELEKWWLYEFEEASQQVVIRSR